MNAKKSHLVTKITINISIIQIFLTILFAKNNYTNYVNKVKIYEQGNYRYIKSNGIPDHETGKFPNRNNPHKITEQKYVFRTPLKPKIIKIPIEIHNEAVGIAINGVPFDPNTMEFWQGGKNWRYEALSGKINMGEDQNHAHVQPNGAYHYHGMPTGLLEKLKNETEDKMIILGYAADGFKIYNDYCLDNNTNESIIVKTSYHLKKGKRPSNAPEGNYDGTFIQDHEFVKNSGDLDECNGHFTKTSDSKEDIYHYHITNQFPYITRTLKAKPDPSFKKKGGGVRRGSKPGKPSRPDRSGRPNKRNNKHHRPPPHHRRPPPR